MPKDVLINAGAGEVRVAVVEDGVLEQLWFERTIGADDAVGQRRHGLSPMSAARSMVGNIVLGRVQRVLPAMQAAFVDIGFERAGFLAAREARPRSVNRNTPPEDVREPSISDFVREGEELLVQVVKDPIGDKGARLSANITIPGRLLIFVANSPGVALSRRIEDETERARLTAIGESFAKDGKGELLPDAGYIMRTAAIGASEAELREDAIQVTAHWHEVTARRRTASAPVTLYHDLGPVVRALRDEVDGTVRRVVIDDREAAAEARAYAARAMPEVLARIEPHDGPVPLFEAWGIEDEIDSLMEPRVTLPSGGWITIDMTEALTVVDVNSGSYVDSSGLEETSLKINMEAAEAIGRQLRLRGIGGLIVIDFIHLEAADNIARVLEALSAATAKGRVPSQILGMSEFGLVEMTRKRVRDPLVKRMTEICRQCDGHGRRKTMETMAVEILRRVERAANAAPGKAVVVRASPVVTRWLEAHQEEIRAGLARRGVREVRFEVDGERRRESFAVETAA